MDYIVTYICQKIVKFKFKNSFELIKKLYHSPNTNTASEYFVTNSIQASNSMAIILCLR